MAFVDACRKGIEVIINERSSKEFETPEEFEYYVEELIWNTKYLTRELDARVFYPEEHKVFEPYETTLEEYLNTLNENGKSKEYLQSRREDAEYRVVVNGKNFFNGNYRRYPIYQLLLIDGEWKFLSYNSIKNSCFIELLEQIMLPIKTIKNETKYEEKAIEGKRKKQSKSATREKHCWNSMNFCRSQQTFQKNSRTGEKQWIYQNLQDE